MTIQNLIHFTSKGRTFFFVQIALFLPAIVILLTAIFKQVGLSGELLTAHQILSGYRTWYTFLILTRVAAIVIIVVGNILLLILLLKSGDFRSGNLIVAVLCISIGVGNLTDSMRKVELVPLRISVGKDIAAIENGELVTVVACLTRSNTKFALPLPGWGKSAPHILREVCPFWSITAVLGDKESLTLLVPNGISYDVVDKGKLMNPQIPLKNQDIQFYRITYTPHLNVVVEVTALE